MKNITLTLVFLSLGLAGHSQFLWISAKNISNTVAPTDISYDQAGNTYVIGTYYGDAYIGGNYISSTTPYKYNAFIAKCNKKGLVLWVKNIGSNENSTAKAVTTDNSGNVYVVGNYTTDLHFDGNTIPSSGSIDAYIMKINTLGSLVWWLNPVGTGAEFNYDVETDNAGNVYSTGNFSGSITIGGNPLTTLAYPIVDMMIAKYDGAGNVLWAQQSGSAGTATCGGSRLAAAAGGHIYVMGNYSGGTVNFQGLNLNTATFSDYYVAKINAAGDFLLVNDLGTISNGYISNIDADAAGNIFVGGTVGYSSPYNITLSGTTITSNGSNPGVFTAKYDSGFNLLWTRSGGATGYGDYGSDLTVSNDGDIYLLFTTYGSTVTFGAISGSTGHPGWSEIGLVKFDTNGNEKWASICGGTDFDQVNSITLTEGLNAVAITGIAGANSYFGTKFIAGTGTYVATVKDPYLREEIKIEEEEITIQLWPNPASKSIQLNNMVAGDAVHIYNMNGEAVYQSKCHSNIFFADIETFPSGIYFIEVINSNSTSTIQFIKQ